MYISRFIMGVSMFKQSDEQERTNNREWINGKANSEVISQYSFQSSEVYQPQNFNVTNFLFLMTGKISIRSYQKMGVLEKLDLGLFDDVNLVVIW